MLGTIVNTISIILGSFAGLILKEKFTDRYQKIVSQTVGIAVVFVGLSSALNNLLLNNANSILFIISLVAGGIIGEFIDIDSKFVKLGNFLESKFGKGESSISKAFVAGSLLFCIGSMSILGSIESSIQGNHNILFAKSVLDGVTSVVFAATMGIGVLFSSIAVFLYQGIITLSAGFIQPYLTDDMLREISIVGGILITCLGLDLLNIKKFKVGNMLPAIFIPVFYYAVLNIIEKL